MPRKGWVKVCPKCQSREVSPSHANSTNNVCLTCGFQGLFPEITKEEAKKLPNKPIRFTSSGSPILASKHKIDHRKPVIIGFIIIIFLLLLLIVFG